MKSILTLLMFFSLLSVINANPNKATIIIESHDHIPIIVELDNQHNNYAQTVHIIDNIRPGNHFIEIWIARNFNSHHGNSGNNVLYRGNIKAFSGYQTVYHVDHGRLVLISKTLIQQFSSNSCSCPNHGHCNNSGCGCNSCSGHSNNNWNNNNYGYNGNNNQCGSNYGYEYNNWSNSNYQGNNYGWQSYPQQNQYDHYGSNNGHQGGMTPQQFNNFMQGLRATNMDGDKVKYIKGNLNDQSLSIDQIQTALDEVFFESNKVEAAKYMYTKTEEKSQYENVVNGFKFSSSKRELNAYINDQD